MKVPEFMKLGCVELNTADGKQSFDIIPVCNQHYTEAYGYMFVGKVAVESLEMERVSRFAKHQLSEGSQERAQYAYESYIANNGAYNSSLSIDGKKDIQIHEFDLSLLDSAKADYYSHQGTKYMFVESRTSDKEFRFYVRDRDLMKAVYERVIKPRQTVKYDFEEYVI